jgi:hypothetical protein
VVALASVRGSGVEAVVGEAAAFAHAATIDDTAALD